MRWLKLFLKPQKVPPLVVARPLPPAPPLPLSGRTTLGGTFFAASLTSKQSIALKFISFQLN